MGFLLNQTLGLTIVVVKVKAPEVAEVKAPEVVEVTIVAVTMTEENIGMTVEPEIIMMIETAGIIHHPHGTTPVVLPHHHTHTVAVDTPNHIQENEKILTLMKRTDITEIDIVKDTEVKIDTMKRIVTMSVLHPHMNMITTGPLHSGMNGPHTVSMNDVPLHENMTIVAHLAIMNENHIVITMTNHAGIMSETFHHHHHVADLNMTHHIAQGEL